MEMYVYATFSGIICIASHVYDYGIPLFHHS